MLIWIGCLFRVRTAFLPALLALVSAGWASAESLTPAHVGRLKTVTSATIAPDGSEIAYVLSVPRTVGQDKDGPAWDELHVLDAVSGESRRFVAGEVNVSGVSWTPDGRGISFLAKRDGDKQTSVYVIPLGGGESERVLALKSSILSHSWSGDGRRLAVVATEPESEEEQKLKDKGFSQEVYEEDWKKRNVYVVEPRSDAAEVKPLPVDGSVFEIAWSPLDDRLAVTVAPTPLVDDSYMRKRVRILDSKDGRILVKVENPGKLDSICWSPDGRHLALLSGADIHDPAPGRLLVASASDGRLTDVIPEDGGHVASMEWLGNGQIGFLYDVGVWTHLEQVGAEAGGRHRLFEGEGGPSATSLSIARDGRRIALVASTPEHPAEVFLWDLEKPQLRRLTNSNPWLDALELAPQELVRYKARDGLELEGLLVRPLNEEPGKRHPLILYVHGGPESHHRNGWLTSYSALGQMAAARGMAVFYANYRGSTGRGVEFSKLSQADPAGKEFDDLVDAVDHLVGTGLADRSRVGVTGGSYGGYATGWLATRYSERFAAGVMFVGISDKISKVGTTDIPDEEFLVHARKRPWGNWQFFLERSPVYYADQGRTPLLILHGKEDPRVNVGQSRELYRHLKIHGKTPVRLVLYPGEGHGNRRAASRLDYNLRALRWMEHYLKGPGGDPPPFELDYGDLVLEGQPSVPK